MNGKRLVTFKDRGCFQLTRFFQKNHCVALGKEEIEMDYKQMIIELLEKINTEDYLIKILDYVESKYEFEIKNGNGD